MSNISTISAASVFSPTKGQQRALNILSGLASHGELTGGLSSRDSNVRKGAGVLLARENLDKLVTQARNTGELRPISRYLNAQCGFDASSKFFISEKSTAILVSLATLKLWVLDSKAEKTRDIRSDLLERADMVACFSAIDAVRVTLANVVKPVAVVIKETLPAKPVAVKPVAVKPVAVKPVAV
jgi:hypothetical protein